MGWQRTRLIGGRRRGRASQDTGKERVLLYEVVADRRRILREILVDVRTMTETFIFEREGRTVTLFGDLEDDERARAHAMVVAENETYLGAFGAEGISPVADARHWFEDELTIIHPRSAYVHLPATSTVTPSSPKR
ncbi:hypothetical protein [Actinomyces mediterranea]|uniref:hypothetical protein n=1 Tax=Actinomyces mediterranea TaxID=1871028 RepID=UPI00101AE50C|nr:hypothetical protein [Actinomyces mediterranea]